MTIQQLSQYCASLNSAQLMPLLYEAEKSLNNITPYKDNVVAAAEQKDAAQQELSLTIQEKSSSIIAIITCAVFAIICFVLAPKLFILGYGLYFLGIICAIGILKFLFDHLKARIDIPKCQQKVQAAEQYRAEAQAQLDQVVDQNRTGLQYFLALDIQELWSPAYLRTFISYFESGRVQTLNEARAMFETYMHRLRLEQKADLQLDAAIATRNAALSAANAAQNAASASQNAANAANRAAFNTKYY